MTARCPFCGATNPGEIEFCYVCGEALHLPPGRQEAAPRPAYAEPHAVPHGAFAERRQVTVMFCDLVGSTPLATRLDPEDLHDAIGTYQRCVTEVMSRRGGFVARFLGDGALVYFGFPRAREDDPECAVHAGLEVVDAVSRLSLLDDYKPQVRVGIATGLCVVSTSQADGMPRELDVTGETPNLAARLQAVAEPSSVVIAASTRRLIGELFFYRDLGTKLLKGFAEPVPTWQVIAPRSVESRFNAQHADRSTPLLGRDAELAAMLRCWREARAGRGQVVLVSGDPGIGKSRLAAMLQEQVNQEPHARLRYLCSPDGQTTPLHPFIEQLEHVSRFTRDDSPATKRDKLVAALSAIEPPAEDVALIADLLSLPSDSRLPKLELTPRERRTKTIEALLRLVELLARRQPVLAVVEDAQWTDPTSRKLLDLAMERLVGWPVLLIVTARPEFRAAWAARPHLTTLTLPPLLPREAIALIRHSAGDVTLADDVVRDIAERSDGVPLFLEELTAAVVDTTLQDGRGSASPAPAGSRPPPVPHTLHASLMARLDRLGPAKEIAHIGAAVGREFTVELVAAITQTSRADLDWALRRLVGSGLVYRRSSPNDSYVFKHALVRDAAYGTMMRNTRRGLHQRIAEALKVVSPAIAQAQPELLAHHYTEADLPADALGYWIKAGQDALNKSAMAEAIARLRKGLELVPRIPEDGWRQQRELELQVALGSAFIATRGYIAPDTIATFSRARLLCKQLNQSPQLISVLHGQWVQAFMRGELLSAQRRGAELLELATRENDAYGRWTGHRLLGTTSFPLGEFAAGREHFDESLRLREAAYAVCRDASAEDDTRAAKLMTFDEAHVLELAYSSWILLYLGDLDQARRRRDDAVRYAYERTQAYTRAHAGNGGVFVELMLGSPRTALARLQELEPLTGGHEIAYYTAMGTIFHGRCLAALGREQEGVARIKSGIAAYRAMGTLVYLPSFLKYLAEACAMAGLVEDGLAALAEAESVMAATNVRQDEAEIHRVRGELMAICGEDEGADASFLAALTVARRQSARLLELLAAMSLARFWSARGKPALGRQHLEPICEWFSGSRDAPVVDEAKSLLGVLV